MVKRKKMPYDRTSTGTGWCLTGDTSEAMHREMACKDLAGNVLSRCMVKRD